MCKLRRSTRHQVAGIILLVIFTISSAGPVCSAPLPVDLKKLSFLSQLFKSTELAKRRLTPEEKARLKKYKSLTPDQRRELQNRKKQLDEMSPMERELYWKRLRQLKNLPPKERKRLKNKLDNWNDLSPSEQDQIRKKFR